MMRRGFTLLEVVIALAIGGMVLLIARGVSDRLTVASSRVGALMRGAEFRVRGQWLLRSYLHQTDVSEERQLLFSGEPKKVSFVTRCIQPAGWSAECQATLTLAPGDSVVLLQASAGGHTVVIDSLPAGARFLFLTDAASGGAWVGRWAGAAAAPMALGIAARGDTEIVRVGTYE